MRRLIDRVLGSKQTAACSGCGLVLTERRRRPCPRCGGINRHISVQVFENIGASDVAG